MKNYEFFNNKQANVDALTLDALSIPICPAPAIPSDDGDGASFTDCPYCHDTYPDTDIIIDDGLWCPSCGLLLLYSGETSYDEEVFRIECLIS